MNEKDNIEKLKKTMYTILILLMNIIINGRIYNQNSKKNTKIHEIDRWENLSQNNTIISTSDPHTNTLNINVNEIK